MIQPVEEYIKSICMALCSPTLYGTPALMSPRDGLLLSNQLSFSTVNEELIIQQHLQEYQRKKNAERLGWRVAGSVIGTCLGLRDGFQANDLLFGTVVGSAAGGIVSEIHKMDEMELKELGLEWTRHPSSYTFHKKRHRGNAIRRLILFDFLPDDECYLGTYFGVQFPDGYVGILGQCLNPEAGQFSTNGAGFDTNWVSKKQVIGEIYIDEGAKTSVELWSNDNFSRQGFAIPYSIPHHYFY